MDLSVCEQHQSHFIGSEPTLLVAFMRGSFFQAKPHVQTFLMTSAILFIRNSLIDG